MSRQNSGSVVRSIRPTAELEGSTTDSAKNSDKNFRMDVVVARPRCHDLDASNGVDRLHMVDAPVLEHRGIRLTNRPVLCQVEEQSRSMRHITRTVYKSTARFRAVEVSTPNPGIVEVSTPTRSRSMASRQVLSEDYRRQLYRQLSALIRIILTMKTMSGLMTDDLEDVNQALAKAILRATPTEREECEVISLLTGRRSRGGPSPNPPGSQVF
ncbi:hypothetical protein hbim_07185 [Mycolicibacterium mageritense]|uniref:Uncharacterized protein n=1 Tax=Mycolicibacterium mageritense TaxID=53462 RepID=A0AAI8U277_MYCME|nr:hypothetical protein hbim_07185 [Mycolicibacterium mageritense]